MINSKYKIIGDWEKTGLDTLLLHLFLLRLPENIGGSPWNGVYLLNRIMTQPWPR